MTAITQEAASRRFHQGATYLMGLTAKSKGPLDPAEIIGTITIMAYLGAYVYPDKNLHGLKQAMHVALEFLSKKTDLDALIDSALDNAEIFRRPWSEETPKGQQEKTI